MKFAKSLLRNEIPEWSQWYIDYKALKKLVKQAAVEVHGTSGAASSIADETNGQTPSLPDPLDERVTTPFFYAIDRNVEVVDNFYNSKFAEYSRRLRHLESQCALMWQQFSRDEIDGAETEEMTGMLLELRSHFRNLHWYAEVNKRGFTKILKKFDKKVGTQAKSRYLSSKILILGFSNGQEITDKINTISDLLQEIAPQLNSPPTNTANAKLTAVSQVSLGLSPFDQLRSAVESDDSVNVSRIMESNPMNAKQINTLISRAVVVNADSVIALLVENSSAHLFFGDSDINRRNIIHKVIIAEGRRVVELNSSSKKEIDAGVSANTAGLSLMQPSEAPDSERAKNSDDKSARSLSILLSALSRRVPVSNLLIAADHHLRSPVHYSARYGLAMVTKLLLDLEPACLKFSDADNCTPLDLAVVNKHPRTLSEILTLKPIVKPSLLLTAARFNASEVVGVLVQEGHYDIDYIDSVGETALHIAAKHKHLETVQKLIKLGANLEIRERTFDWTPIFLAAVDGSIDIADVLLQAGARVDIIDNSGWTVKEHAALRGHLALAEKLPDPPPSSISSETVPSSLAKRRTADETALKTFGHRYLEDADEFLVLVTLGSRDLRHKATPPVQLDTVPMSEAGKTQLDTALSLLVSATRSDSDPHPIDLPIPELGLATEPIPFFTKDPWNLRVLFDLVPTYSAESQTLARGVYIPSKINRIENLNHTMHSVPIIEAQSLRELGQVNFEILIVKPFAHPNNGINVSSAYWRSLITTRVIGHRGLGKNTLDKSSLQLGENTVESFIQAANLGASYVEFDVQLTKDYVPVIYHDFLVGDSGFDIPMHSMTLDQFMNIQRPVRGRQERKDDESRAQSKDKSAGGTPYAESSPVTPIGNGSISPAEPVVGHELPAEYGKARLKRSLSVHQFNRSEDADINYEDAVRRMQYTRDFKTKGFKGNVRGLHIQSKFATLEELFRTLPTGLGFNIEFKYPMLDETEMEEMDGTVIEINTFVDTILKTIFDHKKERDIIISSFNPDVCILLSLKQPSIPVLFLTEGGSFPMMDVRASCLQEAIRFARRFNLLGIVSEASPLIMCPRLVRAVKESGLVCFTYGTSNNVPENARVQLKAGVDAVIVDSVLAIRKELTESASDKDDILVKEVSSAIEQAQINSA